MRLLGELDDLEFHTPVHEQRLGQSLEVGVKRGHQK